jgi:tRNA A-37 threonylcarbamoyl transferase component Bud32
MSDSEPKSEPSAPGAPIKELTGRIGKYDILQPLGKGAMGMVYLAHDTVLERDVALKVMVSNIADDPELNERFKREAKAVAKMTHPNVVNVFDLGNHTDGSPFIAMELLKGMDLQKAVRTPPPMTLDRKVSTIIQVLAGLAHAHQAGIVHRDIKPANIFINHDGTVKIMDFGVARLTTASMTGTGNIVGTADYMSPEQVKGAKVDGRSDLFSVGCMLFELLAGRRPFHSENLMAIFYKITHEEPNYDLIPQGADYDALMPILKKALAKSLDERYQTSYEFAVDLREYLKGHATSETGAHALEGLVDLEPPPSTPPTPIGDSLGPTLVGADELAGGTMDLGGAATARGGAPTAPGRPGTARTKPGTATRAGVAPTVIGPSGAAPRPAPVAPTVIRPMPGPRPIAPPPSNNTVLYAILGVMAVGILGIGGYLVLKPERPQTVYTNFPAQTTPPPITAAPPPSTAPPTTAPPPTFGEVVGKAAASLKGAQAAFSQGDYDRALSLAQSALRADPGNATANRIVENSVNGQRAAGHFRAAEAAMNSGDFAKAASAADDGRQAAPWDSRGPSLMDRIEDARRSAEQQAAREQAQKAASAHTAQVNDLLNKADGALSDQKYDAAISLFDSVLGIEPANQRAILGKSSAIQARAMSQASANAGARIPPGKSFVAGKTTAVAADAGGGSVPPGFEESAGVGAKRGSQAAELPGRVSFDIDPETVKPGDSYVVKISLQNEGVAPIPIAAMSLTTTINGRKITGPVQPQVREVAPQQKALVFTLAGNIWKEDTTSWTMEAVIRTTRGETYKNQVTWR